MLRLGDFLDDFALREVRTCAFNWPRRRKMFLRFAEEVQLTLVLHHHFFCTTEPNGDRISGFQLEIYSFVWVCGIFRKALLRAIQVFEAAEKLVHLAV